MFVGRDQAPFEERAFAAIEAFAEGALCLGALVRDEAGRVADLRVQRVGRRFEELSGLRLAEGRPLAAQLGAEDSAWLEACAEAARSGEARRCALRCGPAGRSFDAVAAPAGETGGVLLLLRAPQAAEVEALRRLHRELSHRVMNSFAALSAMTAMEARAAPPEARAPLLRLQGRVQAMGALYRQLDGGQGGAEGIVDAAAYLRGIAQAFAAARDPACSVETAIVPLALPARRAAPLGLLLYELMTEAAARAGEAPLRLRLSLARGEDGTLALLVEDDAPAGDGPGQGTGQGSGPSALAAAFASELGGAVAVERGTGGTRAALSFRP